MSLSAYTWYLWPDKHSCTSYLDSIGDTRGWTASGLHHWDFTWIKRQMCYKSWGQWHYRYNTTEISEVGFDLFNDMNTTAYEVQLIAGLEYPLTAAKELDSGGSYVFDISYVDEDFPGSSSAINLKIRGDQTIRICTSGEGVATFTQYTDYNTASAAIVQQSISGIPLIPEANFIDALSAVIEKHNGTWIAPASGNSNIIDGDWYPYDEDYLSSSVSSTYGVTAFGEEREYIRTLEHYGSSYDNGDGYNYIYEDLDLDSLTSNFDWLIIGYIKPQNTDTTAGTLGDIGVDDYKPYHMPMVYYPDGSIGDNVKYWYDLGNWMRRSLPSGSAYEIMRVWPLMQDPNLEGWKKYFHTDLYNQEIRSNDPATANTLLWSDGAATDLGLSGINIRKVWQEPIEPQFNGIYVKIEKGQRDTVLSQLRATYAPLSSFVFEDWSPTYIIPTSVNVTSDILKIKPRSDSSTAGPAIDVEVKDIHFDTIGMLAYQVWTGNSDRSARSNYYSDPVAYDYVLERTYTNSMFFNDNSLSGYKRSSQFGDILQIDTWGNVILDNVVVKNASSHYGIRHPYYSGTDTTVRNSVCNYNGTDLSTGVSKGLTATNCEVSGCYAYGFYWNKFTCNWIDFNPNISANGEPIWPLSAWHIENCKFNDNGFYSCYLTGIPANSYFINNEVSRSVNAWYGERGQAFFAENGATAADGQFTLTVTGCTFEDNGIAFRLPKTNLSYNKINRTVGVDHYDRGNWTTVSFSPERIYDNQEWSIVSNNEIRNQGYQNVLLEGHSPSSAWSPTVWDIDGYYLGDLPGLVSHFKFYDNVFSKQQYANQVRGDTGARDHQGYGFMWISDSRDVEVYDNVFIGNEFNGEGYQYGTAIDGTPLTGDFSTGFILGSASAVNIHGNKLGYLSLAFRFNFTDDYGFNQYGYTDGSGQLNDITISGNTLFQIAETFMRWGIYETYVTATIPDSATSNQLDSITDWTTQLDVFNNADIRGQGDNYYLHEGKSRNFKFLDNTLIHDPNWDDWGKTNELLPVEQWRGYWTESSSSYVWQNRFIMFRTPIVVNASIVEQDGNDYSFFFDIKANPRKMAETYFWADDNSTISGNKFHGEFFNERDKKCVQWIVWEDDPESVVANEYPDSIEPVMDSYYGLASRGSLDPILSEFYSSVSADRWAAWKKASTGENWWLHYSEDIYGYGYNSPAAGGIIDLGNSSYFFYPAIARHGLTGNSSGYMSISGWVDYLNTATTGMRGTENELIESIPNLNYSFDTSAPFSFLSELSTTAGIDLDRKEVIFRLYPETADAEDGWNSASGFTFNRFHTLNQAVGHRTSGTTHTTYNSEGYNFSLSSASITGIVIEMMPGHHRPFYDSLNSAREFIYFYTDDSYTDRLTLAENQWLVLRSQDSNNKAQFTHQMSIQDAIDLSQAEGSQAYDTVWDGSSEGAVLTALRYSVSGELITSTDEGDIWVNNPDKYINPPLGYNYGGTMLHALTGTPNSEYTILRFGPVYQGVTGYCVPTIYAEDGRLANWRDDVPAASKIYDILRWIHLDLPEGEDYQILYAGQNDLNTTTTASLNITDNATQEYLNGKYYGDNGDAWYYSPRAAKEYNSYPSTLASFESAYTGITIPTYTGVDGLPLVTKYRDLNVKTPQKGQYLKVRTSKLQQVLDTLTASMLSSSACNPQDQRNYMGVALFTYDNIDNPIKFKIDSVDFKFLGQHAFDMSKSENDVQGKAWFPYWITDVDSDRWYATSYVDYFSSATAVVDGLTGWPRRYETMNQHLQYAVRTYCTQRVEISNCDFKSIFGHAFIHEHNLGSSYLPGGVSLTGYQNHKIENCLFEDILQRPVQLDGLNPANGPLKETKYLEMSSSGMEWINTSFRRYGFQASAYNLGPNAIISGCTFERPHYLTAGYTKHAVSLGYDHPYEGPFKFIDNTIINGLPYFTMCYATVSGNNVYNDIDPDAIEFMGGAWGLSYHMPLHHNCVDIQIYDNYFRNMYVEILFEGTSPWETTYPIGGTTSGDRARLLENINFYNNVVSKGEYKVRAVDEGHSYNGQSKKTVFDDDDSLPLSSDIHINPYPIMWISDVANSNFHDNVLLGNELSEITKTTSWGESVSSVIFYAFTLDSISGVNIYNNKIANITKLFHFNEISGAEKPMDMESGSYSSWGSMGAINDFNFYSNTIYNCQEGIATFEYWPIYSAYTINSTLDDETFLNWYDGVTATVASAALSAVGLYGDNISVSGMGDSIDLHEGKSKNWKIYDNQWIQKDDEPFWSYYPLFNLGYETHEYDDRKWGSPKGIGFYQNSSTQKYDTLGKSVTHELYLHNTNVFADWTPFGDDGSVISGNTFHNWDTTTRNIEWLVYKSNAEALQYIEDNYSTDPKVGYSTDPVGQTATTLSGGFTVGTSAVAYEQWKDLSSEMNWWVHKQNTLNAWARLAGEAVSGNRFYNYVSYNGADPKRYAWVPTLARIRQDEVDDSLMNLDEWVDYLNTSTTGWKGTENATVDYIPTLNYTFDINDPFAFLEEETNLREINFYFYSSSNSTPLTGGWALSGYEHYAWSDTFKRMIYYKLCGIYDANYNPNSICFYDDQTVTAIVINFTDDEYHPNSYWHNKYQLSNTTSLDSDPNNTAQLKLRPDQKLIFRGKSSSDPTIFTQERSLTSVLDEVENTYGISAYDSIWDGTNKGASLTSIEYAISGCWVNTSDLGDVYVKNPDLALGYPEGYNYNGNQTITADPNPDYVIRRFGPVKNGVTGYEIPAIYAEDGKIANAYDTAPTVNTYYDIIRWINKDLPATSDYEIMWVGDIVTHSSSTDSVLSGNLREYINGKHYDDGYYDGNTRDDYSNYSLSLSAAEYASINGGYGGTETNVVVSRFRDMDAKMWETGSWIKIRTSALQDVNERLKCSYVSPSGSMHYYGVTPRVFEIFCTSTGFSPNFVQFENMEFKYLGHHSFDGPTYMDNSTGSDFEKSITSYYHYDDLNPSSTAVFYWSSFIGKGSRYSLSNAPAGLSGYARNYADGTRTDGVVIRLRNVSNIVLENVSVSSSVIPNLLEWMWVNLNEDMSLTSNGGLTANNVNAYDIVGKALIGSMYGINSIYSDFLSDSQRIFHEERQQFEYPSSGISVKNCNFVRTGMDAVNFSYVGSPIYIQENLFDNCSYLTNHYKRHGVVVSSQNPENPVYYLSNTAYNAQIVAQSSNTVVSGNWVEYNFGVDDVEKFKPGGTNGIDIYFDYYSNSVQHTIIDNYALGCPEDALLTEGGAPWGHPFQSSTAEFSVFGNHDHNDMTGRHSNFTITGNVFSTRVTLNKGRWTHGAIKDRHQWASTVWLSDTHDVLFDRNIVLGSDFFGGTDEWGQTVSAIANFAFILDSVSGIEISNNKIAFGNGTFYLTEGSGISIGGYEDNGYWGGAGQYNDVSIHDNIIFEDFRWMFRMRNRTYAQVYLPPEIQQNSSEYQNTEQNLSATLSAFGADSMTGYGDAYQWHQGKSKNLKFYDNKWIRFDQNTYTDQIERREWGHQPTSNDSVVINGISLDTYDWAGDVNPVDLGSNWYWINKTTYADPATYADFTPLGDDNSVMSGNKFYNFNKSVRNIEWLTWKEDPASYISSTYGIEPPSLVFSSLVDPYLKYSAVSAANYAEWSTTSETKNWWLNQQFSWSYSYSGMRLSSRFILPDTSKTVFMPLIAREYQTSDDDSLLTITGWVDYVNSSSHGMNGTENEVIDTIPNLNYTFDISRPFDFLDEWDNNDISCTVTAHFEDQVYQYRKYPRKTVLLKNESGETITDVEVSITSDNFVVWTPGTIDRGSVPDGEYFHVMIDFQPQSVGEIWEGLQLNYKKGITEYIQFIPNCMSGEGIAIPTANYYISVTGDDSNDGSIGSPFRTLTAAAEVAVAGDLIFWRGGTDHKSYASLGGTLWGFNNETATNWDQKITVMAYPGETITIAPTGDTEYCLTLGATGDNYISFEDIVFDNENVKISGSAAGSFSAGPSYGGIISASYSANAIQFWNCEIKNYYDDPLADKYPEGSEGYSYYYNDIRPHISAVSIKRANHRFMYCEIHNCSEHAIYIGPNAAGFERDTDNIVVHGCYIHNLGRGDSPEYPDKTFQAYGVHSNNEFTGVFGRNLQISNNLIKTITSAGVLVGAMLDSHVYNNIIIDCGGGIWSYYAPSSGNHIYNNTIADTWRMGSGSDIYTTYSATATLYENNLVLQATGNMPAWATYYGTSTFDHGISAYYNAVFDDSLALSATNISNISNALVDYSNNVYMPLSASEIVDSGRVIPSLTSDFYGLPRTGTTPDIGAVDYYFVEDEPEPISESISAYPDHFTIPFNPAVPTQLLATNPFSLTNIGDQTIDYTILGNAISAWSIDYDSFVNLNFINFFSALPAFAEMTTGTLNPGSISSCLYALGAYNGILPTAITGTLAVSADDGNIDYITFDWEKPHSGTISAWPNSFEFNYDDDVLSGTLNIANIEAENLQVVIIYSSNQNYLAGLDLPITPDWIQINSVITGSINNYVSIESYEYDFVIDKSQLSHQAYNLIQSQILIISSDGYKIIPIIINPLVTEIDQEPHSSGGKLIYPRINYKEDQQIILGKKDDIENAINSFQKNRDFQGFYTQIKQWIKVFYKLSPDEREKISIFYVLDLLRLIKMYERSGKALYLRKAIKVYNENIKIEQKPKKPIKLPKSRYSKY